MNSNQSPCITDCNKTCEYYCRVKYMYNFLIRCELDVIDCLFCEDCQNILDDEPCFYASWWASRGSCWEYYYPHSIQVMQDKVDLL